MFVRKTPTVRALAIPAVKAEMMMTLANIQTNATSRPPPVCGDLSPYPTVVMVTAAHQNPARSSWSADDDSVVFVEMDISALIDSIEAGTVDVGVAAFTVTRARERRVDFSHPFYNSGLSIAVPFQAGSPILGVARAVLSRTFLTVVGALFLILMLSGALEAPGGRSIRKPPYPDFFMGRAISSSS